MKLFVFTRVDADEPEIDISSNGIVVVVVLCDERIKQWMDGGGKHFFHPLLSDGACCRSRWRLYREGCSAEVMKSSYWLAFLVLERGTVIWYE